MPAPAPAASSPRCLARGAAGPVGDAHGRGAAHLHGGPFAAENEAGPQRQDAAQELHRQDAAPPHRAAGRAAPPSISWMPLPPASGAKRRTSQRAAARHPVTTSNVRPARATIPGSIQEAQAAGRDTVTAAAQRVVHCRAESRASRAAAYQQAAQRGQRRRGGRGRPWPMRAHHQADQQRQPIDAGADVGGEIL